MRNVEGECILVCTYNNSKLYYIYIYIYIYIHTYTQVHKKKFEYHEKGQFFLSLISESETIYYIDSLHIRGKYFKPLFLEILMIMAYR